VHTACFVSATDDNRWCVAVIKHENMKVKMTVSVVTAMWIISTTVLAAILLSCSAWDWLDLLKVCNTPYKLQGSLILYTHYNCYYFMGVEPGLLRKEKSTMYQNKVLRMKFGPKR
jgi:hypothetical protein